MNRLIRMWNQNRKECIAGIIIVIAVFIIIQLLNAYYKMQSERKAQPEETETIHNAEEVKNVEITKETTEEMMGPAEIGETTDERNVKILKQFVQYCNENNAEAAYNMLATETKESLFASVENFTQEYIQKYFQTKRGFDYELWKTGRDSYTYKITLLNDALAEGNFNNTTSYKDYFTILPQDGYWKLNLGGLIAYKEINTSTEEQGMSWNVVGKEVYMNYEIYTIKVSNHSGKTILLDTLQNTKTIFATGDTGTTYSAFSNEIPMANLLLRDYGSSTFKVKFNKIYNSIETESITFSKVITDYETYIQNGETQEFLQVEITVK